MNGTASLTSIRVARTETMLTLIGVPDVPGVAAAVFHALAQHHVPLTMIVQNAPDAGSASITFTVRRDHGDIAHDLARNVAERLGAEGIMKDAHIARITISGKDMEDKVGVAVQFFTALAEKSINVLAINTTADAISCVVEDSATQRAVDLLCSRFGLQPETIES